MAIRCAAVFVLLLSVLSCTERDEQVLETIGVASLLFVDSSQALPSLTLDDNVVQITEWEVDSAVLEYEGAPLDLLFGEPCTFSDAAATVPAAQGKCGGGIILDADGTNRVVRLSLTLGAMRVARAEPPDLTGDFDGDGIPDDGDGSGAPLDRPCGLAGPGAPCDDNCPLIPNPGQEDDNLDGFGDACSSFNFFTGGVGVDSDGDGVVDPADNCVWVSNPLQTNTSTLVAGVQDQIGDACNEQIAVVQFDSPVLVAETAVLSQSAGQTSFLVVDFRRLSCDWDALNCRLGGRIEFCATTDPRQASIGCP